MKLVRKNDLFVLKPLTSWPNVHSWNHKPNLLKRSPDPFFISEQTLQTNMKVILRFVSLNMWRCLYWLHLWSRLYRFYCICAESKMFYNHWLTETELCVNSSEPNCSENQDISENIENWAAETGTSLSFFSDWSKTKALKANGIYVFNICVNKRWNSLSYV